MTKTTMTVAIADITFERALQFRTYTDATHVADLASVWETDGKFQERPVLSRVVDEEGNVKYYVKDGTHRILGAKEAGAEEIEVDVVEVEDFEGALFEAIDVNTRHGKAATVDDLKLIIRAVKDSSRVDEFKKSRFAWDKNKLRALLKCSPRKFERAIVDTNAEFDLERDYEIQKLYETGMSQVSIAKEVECSRRTVQNVIAAYEENKAATFSQMAEMSTPEDELGGQPVHSSQMANLDTPNEDLEDQPATFSQMAEKSTPWDDDVIELTDDYDFEDDVAEDVDNLISSLCRQEELNVVKHTATPKVDIEQWAAMFFSMSSEEQTKALAAINVIK
ncbi:helix-turn-helix domain-containing protein [Vibrio alginolyticus]|nr:helix-turn-helix domain-containing protein [Vibrio alginolyticus]